MNKIEEFKKKYKTIIEYAYQNNCEMLTKQGIEEYYKELESLIQQAVEEQKAVLKRYEEWEAKLIMEDNCWKNGLPELTQELFEEFLDIQESRNQAIREQ